MRGKRLNNREGMHQQLRRQPLDTSLFYYEYLNNSLNYILSGSNDLDHTIQFDNQALRQIISNEASHENIHFVERVKMMKTKTDESLYLKDIQEYGQFINYQLSKSNRQEIMSIQNELQEEFKINILAKRLKKKYRGIDEKTNLYEMYDLQKQMKKSILHNMMPNYIDQYDKNLEENKLYRQMFNIQEVKVKKQEKVDIKKIQKTKSTKSNKRQKDELFHAPASVKHKSAQMTGQKFMQKIISEDQAKREMNRVNNQKLNQAKLQKDLLANSQIPFSLNPPNLIRLPALESVKPKMTIGSISDLLPSWGNPSKIDAASNTPNMFQLTGELIPEKLQNSQVSKNSQQNQKVDLQKKQRKEKKIEKQDKQKIKKPKPKNKEEKPQKQKKRQYNRKPHIVPSQGLKMPQISPMLPTPPSTIALTFNAPTIVATPPPVIQQTIQPSAIQQTNQANILQNRSNAIFNFAQVAPNSGPFSFTPINQDNSEPQRIPTNTDNRQMIPEKVQNNGNLSNSQVGAERPNNQPLNASQRMDVQNRQFHENPPTAQIVNNQQAANNENCIDDFLNI